MVHKFVVIIFFILIVSGCEEDKERVTEIGTVSYISVEGGFYGIVTDRGDRYQPTILSHEYQKDSLRVRFEAIITDLPNSNMWGRTVELIHIEKLQ